MNRSIFPFPTMATSLIAALLTVQQLASGQLPQRTRIYPDPTVEDRTADEPRTRRVASRREDAAVDRSPRGDQRLDRLRAPDLGLWFRPATADLLVIDAVAASGPIAQFGLREGDRIVSVHGQRVTTERDFLNVLLDTELRDYRVPIVVIRDSRRRLIYVRPEILVREVSTEVIDPLERLGIVLDDRYLDRLVVWRVLPRSPAYYAGMHPGDVILTLAGESVTDAGDLALLIDQAETAEIDLGVRRNQEDAEIVVDLSDARQPAAEPVPPPLVRDERLDDPRPDPYSERRLRPRPDVPPGMRVPGGEVGRERGPIAPATVGPTPTTPMRIGFPR